MWKYIVDLDEALQYIDILNSQPVVSIDTETRGLNPLEDDLLLVQFGYYDNDNINTIILDARFVDLSEVFKALRIKEAAFHNAKFDLKFLYFNYGWFPEKIFDTMLAKMLLTNGVSKKYMPSLSDLAFEYFGTKLDKSIRSTFENQVSYFSEEQLGYAVDDAIFTLKLKQPLEAELIKNNLIKVAELEFKFTPVIAKMELTGINFSKDVWLRLLETAKERVLKYESDLRELLSTLGVLKISGKSKGIEIITEIEARNINLNSPIQVKTALHKAGIKVPNTNFDELSLIDHPLIYALLKYRKYERRITTYGQGWIDKNFNPKTGRIHTTFNQLGAVSGRLSSDHPNMQNIINPYRDPDEDMNYREAFIPT